MCKFLAFVIIRMKWVRANWTRKTRCSKKCVHHTLKSVTVNWKSVCNAPIRTAIVCQIISSFQFHSMTEKCVWLKILSEPNKFIHCLGKRAYMSVGVSYVLFYSKNVSTNNCAFIIICSISNVFYFFVIIHRITKRMGNTQTQEQWRVHQQQQQQQQLHDKKNPIWDWSSIAKHGIVLCTLYTLSEGLNVTTW